MTLELMSILTESLDIGYTVQRISTSKETGVVTQSLEYDVPARTLTADTDSVLVNAATGCQV
jgi:hypothetical protein